MCVRPCTSTSPGSRHLGLPKKFTLSGRRVLSGTAGIHNGYEMGVLKLNCNFLFFRRRGHLNLAEGMRDHRSLEGVLHLRNGMGLCAFHEGR